MTDPSRAWHVNWIRWTSLLGALVVTIAGACVVWQFVAPFKRAGKAAPISHRPMGGERVKGFRTSIVRAGKVFLRASAKEISLRRPRVVGPLRIGFLRVVSARDVSVEIFDNEGDEPTSLNPADFVTSSLVQALPRTSPRRVMGAEIEGLHFALYRGGVRRFEIRAKRCDTVSQGTRFNFVCLRGVMRDGDREAQFRMAVFASGVWWLDDALG